MRKPSFVRLCIVAILLCGGITLGLESKMIGGDGRASMIIDSLAPQGSAPG